jgi:signal peptidase
MRLLRKFGWQTTEIALVLIVLALLLGQALGQPILLGFVETESMQPSLEPNDGFVAIPSPLSGPVEEGDVIVFEAQELHGGGLTTHRVVGVTDRGYITKGDANPFLDQDGDEPPVQDEQVVAEALQVNGEVVVIPSLGSAVTRVQEAASTVQLHLGALLGTSLFFGTQGLLNLLVVVCLLAYGFLLVREGRTRDRTRQSSRKTGMDSRRVVAVITLVLVASVTATMVFGAGTHQLTVESSDSAVDGPGLQTGESVTETVDVPNSGLLPVFVVFEPHTEGIEVTPSELRVGGRDIAETAVTVTAPAEPGRVNRVLVEHRYLAVLPESTVHALYQYHAWAPIVVIDALLGIPFYLLGIWLVGTGRIRERSRPRDLPVRTRIRRVLRSLY